MSVKKKSYMHLNQWIATFGAFMFLFQMGIIITWTSPNIAYLTGPDSPIPLTSDQASWLASFLSVGSIAGSIVGSLVNMTFGSKKTILFTFITFAISWSFLIVGNSVIWLYMARLLAGVANGAVYSCFSLYLGEISSPETRGTAISIAFLGIALGMPLGTAAETYLDMKISSSIYFIQCIIGIAIFFWLMDSPYYHMTKNNPELTIKSILFYYKHGDINKKYIEIQDYVEAKSAHSFKNNLRELTSPEVRRSLLVIIILFGIPHLGGIHGIIAYMEVILTGSGSTLIDPQIFIIILNCCGLLLSILTHRLVDVLGRRILLIISTSGIVTGFIGLGIHYFLLRSNFNMEYIQWLPLASVFTSMLFYGLGCATVPSTVLSETFTNNTKSIAACIASLASSFGTFICIKMYQPMVDSFGEAYIFWLYAVISVSLVPCTLFLMIETKGKTFQEIQYQLKGSKKANCNSQS